MENKKSEEIIVKFEEVTKQYGDLVVLDKLNLDIKKNEMVSIIGPSGSGKTTVLRVLMTLEKINGGVIHLDGEALTHMDSNGKLIEASEKYLRERRSKIGMVFQQFNLFPHMTALQNCIEAPVEVLGMKKEDAEQRALGIGGVPKGRIVEIYGPESSGKTTLATHIVAESQKMGGNCAFIDAEHCLDPAYAKKLGVNLEDLLISQPDTGEQGLEIADSLIKSGGIDVLVIDSVAALVPRAELEGDMGD